MMSDFVEASQVFVRHNVRFLVVGAYALALHGRPRFTIDLDLWVDPTPENAARVIAALRDFGAPMSQISEADFAKPGMVFQMGVAPSRIDVITQLTGLQFEDAWKDRSHGTIGPCEVAFIGKAAFIKNKRATGRPKDIVDADAIE